VPFVLDGEVRDAGPAGDRGEEEERRVAFRMGDDARAGIRQNQLAEPPHAGGVEDSTRSPALRKELAKLAAAPLGRPVSRLEES